MVWWRRGGVRLILRDLLLSPMMRCSPPAKESSHTSDLQTWYCSGHPAWRLVSQGQCWDLLALVQRAVLTYLCPSLPVEHRSSKTPRYRTLFWAALVIPDQLVPCCFSSASVSLLLLLRGRPLFLFPCGFQVRAWRVVLDAGFLKVCPIQPHFLRSICLATGSCPARSYISSFRIFSCHWIL